MLEREVKLSFDTPDQARSAVAATGAALITPRRLQEDALFDTSEKALRARRCILRVRSELGRSLLTFKASVLPGAMKVREEYETAVSDREALMGVLEGLGLQVWFRYEKYREEYAAPEVTVALDETPVGTFVEIEGSEEGIVAMTRALGRTPDDFILESYRGLFLKHRENAGLTSTNMLFSGA